MKNWFWIPLVAIVGGIAGSWGPREDLAKFKESIREERAEKKVSQAAGFDAFARLANIPDIAKRRPKARTNELARKVRPLAPSGSGEAMTNVAVAARAGGTNENRLALNDDHRPTSVWMTKHGASQDLRARIEEAADLWQTRVELAKTQWKAKLGISGEKASASFESAVATMNESLRDSMQALADEIELAGKMTPELSLRMMGDAARVMAEAYDAVGAALPDEKRAEVSDMPVFEFIDPMVAEPLIGVQDKLDGGFGRTPRREDRRP